MLDAMQIAITRLAGFDAIGTLLIGTFIGITFGALPGLGSVIALALVLPFTYGMDPMLAMLLYAGIMSSVTFGGSVPAILLNTPGTPPNAATCFDGYPMARRGEGARALAISATACFFGSLGGVVITLTLLPLVKPIVYAFGPPEFFWLVAFGMVMIAFAARGNMIKGLAGGGIGIMISMIGYDDMTGSFRYTHGSNYLWDGLPLVTFVTGLFAISELIAYASRGGATVSESVEMTEIKWGTQVFQGIWDVVSRPVQWMRAAAIGAGVGIIPGLGGGVASFMSYIVGMHRARDPESYGHGNPEGIIASETANDAKDGGALLPTVSFGIPGSPDTAILLGAFILHGLQPGPGLLRDHMDIVCLLLFGIFISQIGTSVFGLLTTPILARISVVKSRWLAPFVLSLVVVGTYMLNQNILDSGIAILVGIMGYVLRRFGFPLITVAIGFILGPLIETSMLQSLLISGGKLSVFVSSPIAVILMLCTFGGLFGPFIMNQLRRARDNGGEAMTEQE